MRALFGAELEFERELGRGGMAAVYLAFDHALERRVAVKAMLPDIAREPGMAERFLREARTVAALQHPHVVSVYGVRGNDAAQAIVMQYVEGRSLDAMLAAHAPLALPVAAMVLTQAASGLQHAHDRGVVHRDVKPANVLVNHDGQAFISDFGIARRDTGPRTTATGLVVGTWAYMSPEQRTGQAFTAATDQYAFGVMAFELLTGRLPFTGTPTEILHAHLNSAPPSLRALRPEVPAGIEGIVHRLLSKKAEQRFPSLRDAERAFAQLVPDERATTQVLAEMSTGVQRSQRSVVTARVAPPPAPPAPDIALAVTERMPEAAAPAPPIPKRRTGLLLAAAVPVVAAILAAVWFITNGAQNTQSGTIAEPAVARGAETTQKAGGASVTEGVRTPQRQTASKAAPATSPPAPSTTAPKQPTESTAVAAPQSSAPPATADRAVPAGSTSTAAAPPPATLADARQIGREFVTLLNQRQYLDLAKIPSTGGDAGQRAELLRLTQNAADFSAGFDRVASSPDAEADGFTTAFVVDVEWRGGQRLFSVVAHASHKANAWTLTGFAVDSTP